MLAWREALRSKSQLELVEIVEEMEHALKVVYDTLAGPTQDQYPGLWEMVDAAICRARGASKNEEV